MLMRSIIIIILLVKSSEIEKQKRKAKKTLGIYTFKSSWWRWDILGKENKYQIYSTNMIVQNNSKKKLKKII